MLKSGVAIGIRKANPERMMKGRIVFLFHNAKQPQSAKSAGRKQIAPLKLTISGAAIFLRLNVSAFPVNPGKKKESRNGIEISR